MIIDFKTLSDPTLLTEFVTQVGYVAETNDIDGKVTPNPVSEEEFATQFLRDSVASYIRTYEINNAVKTARDTTTTEANDKIDAARATVELIKP